MGSGASFAALPKEALNEAFQEEALTQVMGGLSREQLQTLQKVVSTALDSKKPGLGNADAASDMKRAMWMWSKEIVSEAFDEIGLPNPKCNGKQLLVGEVVWKTEGDKWKEMAPYAARKFMGDQFDTPVPFEPPESAKKRAVYLWSVEQVDEFLKELGVKPQGKSAKELVDDDMDLEDEDRTKVNKEVNKLALMFQEDVSMADSMGNAEKGTDMQRAIFMWDKETTAMALKEIEVKDAPEATGKQLLAGDVSWESADKKKWEEEMLPMCVMNFLTDQVEADTPFEPPAEVKQRCVYLWDEAQADEFLKEMDVKPKGKSGKQLLQLGGELEPELRKALANVGVMFMQDLAQLA
ncbi:unnamed protein product [Effrenium voratum]|nr:unnamed protein product [Effrenium voratum]